MTSQPDTLTLTLLRLAIHGEVSLRRAVKDPTLLRARQRVVKGNERAARARWTAIALVVASALRSAPSAAQSDEVEREHAQGMALRQAGRHAEAAAFFRDLYDRTREPRALARWGLAVAASEEWARAEEILTRALAMTRDRWIQENRAGLERNLARVREHLPTVSALAVTPSAAAAPAPVEARRSVDASARGSSPQRIGGVVSLALGGAGVLLGGVAFALRNDQADTFNSRGCQLRADRDEVLGGYSGCVAAYDAGRAWEAASIAGFAAGGALAVTGIILLATARRPEGTATALRCGPTLGAPGISCGASF